MPQIQTQTPDLRSIYGSTSSMPAFYGQQQFQLAQQQGQQNLAGAVQEAQQSAAQQPYTLQEMAARTNEMNARVPMLQQQSRALGLENDVNAGVPLQDRIKAKQVELATKMSDAEIKQHENEIQKWLYDPDPAKQALGQKAWEQISAVKQEKMKLDSQREQAKQTALIMAQSRVDVGAGNNRAQVEAARLRAEGMVRSTMARVQDKTMSPSQAATRFGVLAEMADNEEDRAKYTKLSNDMETMAQKLKPETPVQVNPGAVGGGVLVKPPLPGPTINPGAAQPRAPVAQPTSQAPAMSSNTAAPKPAAPPPAGRLYVRDVKTNTWMTIPENQLEEAMKQGYEYTR